jgi:hypothetical protein
MTSNVPSIRFSVIAPSQERLKHVLERLLKIGAKLSRGGTDARLQPVIKDGVAPQDFYGIVEHCNGCRAVPRPAGRPAGRRIFARISYQHSPLFAGVAEITRP